jgi:hypothetical protein
MQIKIAEIRIKTGRNNKGDWKQTTIVSEGDKPITASTFEPNELVIGDTIEAEVEIKGNYSNLISFRKLSPGTQPQPNVAKPTAQKEAPQPQKQYVPSSTPISGAEKGLTLREIGDNFRAGLFTQGTQPDLWAFYKSELSRVSGVTIN